MNTKARIRASIAVICTVFALLVTSGLAVRGQVHATQASGHSTTTAVTAAASAAPVSGEGDDNGALEAD